jgi:hypothetical protein
MKERAKALLSKIKNELPAVRTLYVSLDRADNVIEGGPPFPVSVVSTIDLVHARMIPLRQLTRRF